MLALTALLGVACQSGRKKPADEPTVTYPPAPDPPRVQFLRSISFGSDIEKGRSTLDSLIFGDVNVEKSLMAPYGVEVRDDIIYVADIQQTVVLKLDLKGESFGYIKLEGRGVLQKPCNLDFAKDGRLYIADLGRKQVVVLDPDQKYEREFGPFGDGSRPVDVDVDGDLLFVVDGGLKKVLVLDRFTGEEIRSFGGKKEGERTEPDPEELRAPTNLTVGGDGNLYVVDTIDCSLYVWGKDGTFHGHVGSAGDTVGQFARPKGIAAWKDILFVVDAAFENCQILDLEGEPLMFFGGSGIGPGDLYLPAGVWIGTDGLGLFERELEADFVPEALVVITNLYGPRKVNFYAFGKSTRFEYSEDSTDPPTGEIP